VGSGKKAFCAVHLSLISAIYAQLYPHNLWISFAPDSESRGVVPEHRVAPGDLRPIVRPAPVHRLRTQRAGNQRSKNLVRMTLGKAALLKNPAEAKVAAIKNFQES
jgi:hypothetical protein